MISTHLRIDSFDEAEWIRLRQLLTPARRPGRPGINPPLALILEQGRLVRALRPGESGDARRAAIAAEAYQGPASLEALRAQTGARLAIAIEAEAIERITAAVDRGVDPQRDLVEQSLVFLRAFQAELGRGLWVSPEALGRIPLPSYSALSQSLDALLPDDRCLALLVFDQAPGRPRAIHASLIIEKQRGHISRLTSHRALGPLPEPADFDGGRHRLYLEALERAVARPHAALFCTKEAWREIVGPGSGALAAQVAQRAAVIDPIPPWLLAMTSIGAAAGVARGASRLLGLLVPRGAKESLKQGMQSVQQGARSLTSTPFAALGFDPIELYQELRKLL